MADAIVPPQITEPQVQVINPEGSLVNIPAAQMPDAVEAGYQLATPEEVHSYQQEAKYGSLPQQAATALEGAAAAATFGVSTGLETALGVKPEDIQGRRETNPVSHAAGQIGGLLAPIGAAGALEKAGVTAAEIAGLAAPATLSGKLGSGALKMATENALFEAGDEVSRMFAKDPAQSVETAVTDMGLSALLGGGFGTVSPLWHATVGPKVSEALSLFKNKAGGIDGAVPSAITDAEQKFGIQISPEVKAALSGSPELQNHFVHLMESNTATGEEARKALSTFKTSMADELVKSFGKDPALLGGTEVSSYEVGDAIKKQFEKELKAQIEPISKDFRRIRDSFEEVYMAPNDLASIANNIGEMVNREGYYVSPSSPQMKEISRVLTEIPNIKTLKDLTKYQSILYDNTAANPELQRVGKLLRGILRDGEESAVDAALVAKSADHPNIIAEHSAARQNYRQYMNMVDDLNDVLHVGRFHGPDSFIKAVSEATPETFINRIGTLKNVEFQKLLSEKFPAISDAIRSYHSSSLLEHAASKASAGESVNAKTLLTSIDKLSPEAKSFLLGPEGQARVDAIAELLNKLPSKANTSGTARTLDKLWEHLPESGMASVAMLMGHNPIGGAALGFITKKLSKDVPDAAKMALLKYMGSNGEVSSAGFKTLFDFATHNVAGAEKLNKSIASVFKSGATVLSSNMIPKESDIKKLDKQLQALQVNERPMLNVGGNTGHYLPDQAQHMGSLSMNAVTIINGLRPANVQMSPLDVKQPLTPAQKTQWQRTLTIAEQPLTVVPHIKAGTIHQSDVQLMQQLYPALYSSISQKLMAEVTKATEKGHSIPYETRMGISTFLGQPLDSTMTPMGILHAQPPPPAQKQPVASGMDKLKESARNDYTATQAREIARAK